MFLGLFSSEHLDFHFPGARADARLRNVNLDECAVFVVGAALYEPRSADFVAGA